MATVEEGAIMGSSDTDVNKLLNGIGKLIEKRRARSSEPTCGVDNQTLPQLASELGQASRQLSQTIIVTHHGTPERATNILNVTVSHDDGSSHIVR